MEVEVGKEGRQSVLWFMQEMALDTHTGYIVQERRKSNVENTQLKVLALGTV